MTNGHSRMGCVCRNCGIQLHDWQDQQYYCPYIDGHSSRSFACDSCGDRLYCEGEMVHRVCKRCGAKEWVYSTDIRELQACSYLPKKEENA